MRTGDAHTTEDAWQQIAVVARRVFINARNARTAQLVIQIATSGVVVGGAGLGFRGEGPEISGHPAASDYGAEAAAALVGWANAARGSAICHVHLMRGVAQIAYAVIELVAVDVINAVFGPASVHVKPDKPVRQIATLPNHDGAVAVGSDVAGLRSVEPIDPEKFSGLGIAAKYRAKLACRKVVNGRSHAETPR